MHATKISTGLIIALATVGLAACSPADGTPEASASVTPTVAPPTEAPTTDTPPSPSPDDAVDPADAPEILQFSASTLAGEAFEGSSLYGTPTVLWFWAPWCPTCQAEASAIADALDELPEGVQLIGVPGRADEESMRAFVERYGLEGMVQIVDADGDLWSRFSVTSQPAITLIDVDGGTRTLPGSIGKAGLLAEAESIA